MLEIRPAKTADHKRFVQLWHQGWHGAHAGSVPSEVLAFRTKDHFSLWLKEAQDAFYVAIDDDGVLGFVSVKGDEVVKLYVSNRARGTGAAHSLLSFAEGLLRNAGIRKAVLLYTAGNVRAERFYEREGWELTHSLEDALSTPAGDHLQATNESMCDEGYEAFHVVQKMRWPSPKSRNPVRSISPVSSPNSSRVASITRSPSSTVPPGTCRGTSGKSYSQTLEGR